MGLTANESSAFAALYDKAHAAGIAAGRACKPIPMVVTDGVTREVIDEGACGFGWVILKPARGKLVQWLKTRGEGRSAYGGGCYLTWCAEFGQSYERKSAYVAAFARVYQEAGYNAMAQSRLD